MRIGSSTIRFEFTDFLKLNFNPSHTKNVKLERISIPPAKIEKTEFIRQNVPVSSGEPSWIAAYKPVENQWIDKINSAQEIIKNWIPGFF